MRKDNHIFLGLLIILFAIVVYFLVFKKSEFGATTTDIRSFVTSLKNGTDGYSTVPTGGSGKAPAGTSWTTIFLPSATNLTRYSSVTTTISGLSQLPPGPFLLYDPGWVQPTSQSSSSSIQSIQFSSTYSGIDANNILGASSTGPNAGSISTTSLFTPVIGWAASYLTNTTQTQKSYYYSPTCLSAIPNPFIYTTSSTSATATPLNVTDGYFTTICANSSTGSSSTGSSSTDSSSSTPPSGPGGTCGEYGAFNAYFQYDYYASAFMNNDTQFWPFFVTSGTVNEISDISNLSGVTTYYTQSISAALGSFTTTTTFKPTISYSQAVGIPADAVFNDMIDIQGGYTKKIGTPMSTMGSIGLTSGNNISASQTIRRNTIVGVLIAMHSLMSGTSSVGDLIATNGPFKSYTNGILTDLKYYYNQNQYSGVTPIGGLLAALKQTHTYDSTKPPQSYAPININSIWNCDSVKNSYSPDALTALGITTGSPESFYYTAGTTTKTVLQLNNTTYPVSLNNTGIFISNNTRHAIYLTLMARDNWIKNQLNNINLI